MTRAAVVTHGKAGQIGAGLARLQAVAAEHGVELVFPGDEAEKHGVESIEDASGADIAVVLGGDGTVLRALTLFLGTGVPVIGVNFGRVGFLSSMGRRELEAGMARVKGLGDSRTRYRAEPVDAMTGGGELEGVRTMSGALHHFPPDAVRSLIAGIVARRAPLAFFDVAASPAIRKAPLALAPVAMGVNMVLLFLGSLALVPFVRPFRLSRLLLTYLLFAAASMRVATALLRTASTGFSSISGTCL